MSKDQWGHGYHSGVADAIAGASIGSLNKNNIANAADRLVIALENYQKWLGNWSPIPIARVEFILSTFEGGCFSDREIDLILRYIWENEPRGAYISGYPGKALDYENDFIVV